MRILLIILVFLFSDLYSQVYEGTVGKSPVVFEFIQDEFKRMDARYFYKKFKGDIRLSKSTSDAGIVSYCTDNADQTKTAECFIFKSKPGNKLVSGTWNKGTKSLEVKLSLIDTAKLKPLIKSKHFDELKKFNLYGFMKILDMTFKPDGEQKWDESTTLSWLKDPYSGIRFFRIKLTSKTKNVTRVNQLLEDYHLRQVKEFHQCIDGAPYGGEYGFSGELTYLSESLISFHCFSGYYCGGAHPDGGEWGMTYDCNSLKELSLSHLYWFSDKKTYVEGVPDDQDQNMSDFEETWHSIVQEQYGEFKNESDDCQFEPNVWSKYTFVLTKEGLHIGAYFPRVARNCDTGLEWPIVPYAKIDQYRVNKKRYYLK